MTSAMTGLELSKLTVAAKRRSELLTYLSLDCTVGPGVGVTETLLPSDIRRCWN
jgi:hypothetical protein